MSSSVELDFSPISQEADESISVRPSRSYGKMVWQRLRANRRAFFSLIFILLLVASCFLLPLILNLDGSRQHLHQISEAPAITHKAVLVSGEVWSGPQVNPSLEALPLSLAEPANTESVRLRWPWQEGVRAYRVYRHILAPSGERDLGLPLATVVQAQKGWGFFDDRLKLEVGRYYYSIKPEGLFALSLAVDVEKAIRLDVARSLGLITDDQKEGYRIKLQSHLLGTDYLGRDMLARLIHGGQTSLFIGLLAPFLAIGFGVFYGALSGFVGGYIDNGMMRFADFVIALPFLLFMILIRVAMGIGPGESGVVPMLVALVILGWPSTARLVRGQVLQLREQPYVQAARLMGSNTGYLIARHILPNVMGLVLVQITFAVPTAIFTEAFLSFIGMGVAPPTPSWGAMCNDGLSTFLSHPHQLLIPSLVIASTVLAFNLLGDGLRDALDVKLKG